MAAGAFFLSGCKTTESASADHHQIIVKLDRNSGEGDQDSADRHVSIVVERDGEEPIHIKGDPASAEVKEQLAFLKTEGVHIVAGMSEISDQGGWQFILKDGGELKTIVGTGDAELDGDGNHVFIGKEDGSKADKSHRTLHKKVIVIKGDTEQELREQLREQGFDLEFDLEPGEEETDEEVGK